MKTILVVPLLLAVAAPAGAQYAGGGTTSELPKSFVGGLALHYGSPQGEFANNVSWAFGGNGFLGWRLGSSPFVVRADMGYSIYGSETRRVPLGRGVLGLINVDVNTTNNILDGDLALQAGAPGAGVRPYVGGSMGFSYFFTESSVAGSHQMNSEAFASSTNASDVTLAKTLFGGFYIPVWKGSLDIGARYHWNGEALYLTDRDISFDRDNNPVLSPRRSRADLLTIQVGYAVGRR